VQLVVDLLSVKFVDKIGYRTAMLIAHGASALGLAGLAFLPDLLPPFWGLTACVCVYAIGGGISARKEVTDSIRKGMDRLHAGGFPLPFSKPEIVTCEFRNDANLIGALAFCLDR
jgi:MFS family permease